MSEHTAEKDAPKPRHSHPVGRAACTIGCPAYGMRSEEPPPPPISRRKAVEVDLPPADVVAAIRRIEASRQTHVEWAEHLRECDYCREYPPAYVHSAEEQGQIVAEYDNVLACLRSIADASAQAWARGKWSGHSEECRAIAGDTGRYRDCICANPYSVTRETER